jgi:hypothetical protein
MRGALTDHLFLPEKRQALPNRSRWIALGHDFAVQAGWSAPVSSAHPPANRALHNPALLPTKITAYRTCWMQNEVNDNLLVD